MVSQLLRTRKVLRYLPINYGDLHWDTLSNVEASSCVGPNFFLWAWLGVLLVIGYGFPFVLFITCMKIARRLATISWDGFDRGDRPIQSTVLDTLMNCMLTVTSPYLMI